MVDVQKHDLVVSRVVETPVSAVWRLWTVPELVRKWWGPQDYTAPRCEIDLRVGGRYLFCMRAPVEAGGQEYFSVGTYVKIDVDARLEFTQSFANAAGEILPASDFGMPDLPDEVQTVVEFESLGTHRTRLTITQFEQPLDPTFQNAVAGWNQSIDKIVDALADAHEYEALT